MENMKETTEHSMQGGKETLPCLIRALASNSAADVDRFEAARNLFEGARSALAGFKPLANRSTESNPIQLLDFFSGAGGTTLGFCAVNAVIPAFRLLGGCDINDISAQSYSNNFGTPKICEDIRRLASDPKSLAALLDAVGYNPRQKLVLIGCAPCQGFTSHTKKRWNEADDVRNGLPWAFASIVERLLPDAIVMENVPEFLGKKYWRYYATTKQRFEELGYVVKAGIYNAATFGVPQERFRAVLLAMRKDFALPQWELKPQCYRTVRDAIGDLPAVAAGDICPGDPMHKSARHSEATLEVIRSVPHDGGNRPRGIGPACLDKTNGFSDVYGRLFWDRPSITITHYARNPASGRFSHPEQDRGLTMREVARLQSFPDGFAFTGRNDDVYRQIGEAVPPHLATALAAHILVELLSPPPSAQELAASPAPVKEPVSSSYSSVIAGIKQKAKRPDAGGSDRFTCIDGFCGAGGLALGLKRAGFEILSSFDIDEKCIRTINANPKYFGHHAEVADISSLLGGVLREKCHLSRGDLFLLAGGPPCQGFSVQRHGPDSDPRNQLVLKYGQLIDELYPKFFLMENVSGIAGKRGKTILQELIETVEAVGYEVHVRLLDAADYGVPQRRRRYIVIGKRNDVAAEYRYPEPRGAPPPTVRETIGHLPAPPEDGTDHPDVPLHRRDRLSPLNLRRINAISQGQGRDDLPSELLADCHQVSSDVIGYRNVYGRMAWDDVAPTITARFDSFTRGKFGHPDQPRSISLREGALLQTFPEDFVFTGSKVEVARQIGNAVPPVLAEAIGKSIIESFKRGLQ